MASLNPSGPRTGSCSLGTSQKGMTLQGLFGAAGPGPPILRLCLTVRSAPALSHPHGNLMAPLVLQGGKANQSPQGSNLLA